MIYQRWAIFNSYSGIIIRVCVDLSLFVSVSLSISLSYLFIGSQVSFVSIKPLALWCCRIGLQKDLRTTNFPNLELCTNKSENEVKRANLLQRTSFSSSYLSSLFYWYLDDKIFLEVGEEILMNIMSVNINYRERHANLNDGFSI